MFAPKSSDLLPQAARFAAAPGGHLSAEMKAAYARDGFLVLEGMVSAADE